MSDARKKAGRAARKPLFFAWTKYGKGRRWLAVYGASGSVLRCAFWIARRKEWTADRDFSFHAERCQRAALPADIPAPRGQVR